MAEEGTAEGGERAALNAPTRAMIVIVRLYQIILSPIFGGQCRFVPSCSSYAIDALRLHGALRGSWLGLRRILRCHPFGAHGYDPVPPMEERQPQMNADAHR